MLRLSEVASLDTFARISATVESVMDELTQQHLIFSLCLGIFGEVTDTCWLGQFGSEVCGAFLLLARMLERRRR